MMDCALRIIHHNPLSTAAFSPKKVRIFTVKCSSVSLSSEGSSIGEYCFCAFIYILFKWVGIIICIYALDRLVMCELVG